MPPQGPDTDPNPDRRMTWFEYLRHAKHRWTIDDLRKVGTRPFTPTDIQQTQSQLTLMAELWFTVRLK